MGYTEGQTPRTPAFHNIYIQPEAYRRFAATGKFPDKTMLAPARRLMEGIFEASRPGLLDIEHVTPERFSRAWRLRLRYHDKPRISFTDLTSSVTMSELRLQHVLTGDAHFEQVGMGFIRIP